MAHGAPPHYVTETQILRRVANDPECRWRFTKHSLVAIADDQRTVDDVKHGVMGGRVILEEHKKDILWRVEGTDVDGNRIRVVAAVDERQKTIKVVTTF